MKKKLLTAQNFLSFQMAKLLQATSFFSPQELLPPQAQRALMEQSAVAPVAGRARAGAPQGVSVRAAWRARLQQPGVAAVPKPDKATRDRLAAAQVNQTVAKAAKPRHVKRQAGAPLVRSK